MEIIDLELKTLLSGHDFQSQGRMTLKIVVVKIPKNLNRPLDEIIPCMKL